MLRRTALIAAGLTAIGFAAYAAAPANMMLHGAWARPAAAGANSAGYVTLHNGGGTADTLLRIESAVATKVELHESSTVGGVAKMSPVASVEIGPGKKVEFAPGGKHIMFIGLKKALKAGDKVPATFVFQRSGKKPGVLTVRAAAPAKSDDHSGH